MSLLEDTFGRKIEYLRLSVTDRCDFRCFYCIPKGFKAFTSPDSWLTLDETVRLVRLFSELGVAKLRVTGGEPLVRKDLPELVRRLGTLPNIRDLSLSTNASRLALHAKALQEAGIGRINVSLDSLDPACFRKITQSDLEPVIQGLMAAKSAGFHPVKINMVLMKGLNDQEICDMVDFCLEHGFTLRLIETMPVGEAGQGASGYFMDLDEAKARLESRYALEPTTFPGAGPASYYRVKGSDLNIGFITPISRHFCATCNRVRLSAAGTLYLCLGQSNKVELLPLIRRGGGDGELKQALIEAVELKAKHHGFSDQSGKSIRGMSITGG